MEPIVKSTLLFEELPARKNNGQRRPALFGGKNESKILKARPNIVSGAF